MEELDVLTTQEVGTVEQEMYDNGVLTGENGTELSAKIAKKQGTAPRNDNDILAVLNSLLPKWDDSTMPVAWMTKDRLQELSTEYSSQLMNRKTKGASRGSITSSLRRLDDEMDINIEHVKNRLAERLQSKQEAVARYREFGIVKEKSFKLPLSREDRAKALPMLINALTEYQFLDTTFGIEYWTDISARYNELVLLARETDGNVSSKVGSLNQFRNEVRKFHNSFISIVKGNYPDTWKSVLREYGYQKEKY